MKTLAVKELWQIWQITAIHQVFLPIFTISITFPMQMDFNSPKCFSAKLPAVLIHQTFFPPKFFTMMVTNFAGIILGIIGHSQA